MYLSFALRKENVWLSRYKWEKLLKEKENELIFFWKACWFGVYKSPSEKVLIKTGENVHTNSELDGTLSIGVDCCMEENTLNYDLKEKS